MTHGVIDKGKRQPIPYCQGVSPEHPPQPVPHPVTRALGREDVSKYGPYYHRHQNPFTAREHCGFYQLGSGAQFLQYLQEVARMKGEVVGPCCHGCTWHLWHLVSEQKANQAL